MECYHCRTKLIWNADHVLEDHENYIVTHLSCPNCDAFVEIYLPEEKKNER